MRHVPLSLRYINTWCPVGSTVWEGSGGMTLLEEVCRSLEMSFTSISLTLFPALCFMLAIELRSLNFLLLWQCGLLAAVPPCGDGLIILEP